MPLSQSFLPPTDQSLQTFVHIALESNQSVYEPITPHIFVTSLPLIGKWAYTPPPFVDVPYFGMYRLCQQQ
jgi:hypothetical protein